MKPNVCGPKRWRDILVLLTVALLLPVCTQAQDRELDRLVDIVRSLRSGDRAAFDRAVEKLAADKKWTPMDELATDRSVECRASERVSGFRLNAVLTNAESKERYQVAGGRYLNGADSRYNYSLYEKTLQPGKTATFSLSGRWGAQTIVIVPYQNTGATVTATAESDGRPFGVSDMGDGALRLTGSVAKGSRLTLKVTNASAQKVSYVVLNHNSRE